MDLPCCIACTRQSTSTGSQVVSHQRHGISGWFQLCESSVWSIVQALYVEEWTQSSWLHRSLGLAQQAWLSKQHYWSRFARTARVMSVLPTYGLTHLLFTKGLEGPDMGMMSVSCFNSANTIPTQQSTSRRGCRNSTTGAVLHEQQAL